MIRSDSNKFVRKVVERNGDEGRKWLMLYFYGAKLTSSQIDELIICSRLVNKG